MPRSASLTTTTRTARSKVTNGTARFVADVDGRSREARRFRDVLAEIVSDLGGPERLSEGQRQLARRCALMSVECERMEGEAVAGKAIDIDQFGQLTDRLGRAFQRLGLKRVKKDLAANPLAEHFSRPPMREPAP